MIQERTPLQRSIGIQQVTQREREVFQSLAEGGGVRAAAERLEISEHTIRRHQDNVRRKLACGESAGCVAILFREGILK